MGGDLSIRAIAWAFDQRCPSPIAKLVLIKLADNANEDGICWPSQARIAEDCGLTRETVNRNLQLLTRAGFISAEQRVGVSGKESNVYTLRFRDVTLAHSGCDGNSPSNVTQNAEPCDGGSLTHVTQDHTEPSYRTVIEPSPRARARGVKKSGSNRSGKDQRSPRQIAHEERNRAARAELARWALAKDGK